MWPWNAAKPRDKITISSIWAFNHVEISIPCSFFAASPGCPWLHSLYHQFALQLLLVWVEDQPWNNVFVTSILSSAWKLWDGKMMRNISSLQADGFVPFASFYFVCVWSSLSRCTAIYHTIRGTGQATVLCRQTPLEAGREPRARKV